MKKRVKRRSVIAGSLSLTALSGLSLGGGISFASGTGVVPLTPVRVFSFPGNLNLLIWVGQEKNIFRKEGLDVSHDLTPTSMVLIEKMVMGEYDIALSSIDNVIAYNSGQGQATLSRPSDLFSFMNISQNMELPLIVRGDIADFDALRGGKLAVDAVSTGFSLVLRKILEVHGIMPGEYQLVSVGNSAKRYKAMLSGEYDGAILTPPFNQRAKSKGLKQLGRNRDFDPNYQGPCFVATQRFAASNPNIISAFSRAQLSVYNWLRDEDNNQEAAEILAKYNKGVDVNSARAMVRGLARGLSPDFNIAGIKTVINLRAQYAKLDKELVRVSDFIDVRYLEDARGSL